MRLIERVVLAIVILGAILYAMTYGPHLVAVALGCAFVGVLVLAIIDSALKGHRHDPRLSDRKLAKRVKGRLS
jgi:hypothetical protein